MKDKYYITTPLYYVNGEPHIGHAYTTILADVLARYQRFFGRDVHFLTGLDEHGQKVANAAAARNIPPQDHCDEMALTWRNAWDQLDIHFDDFIRTTEPRHEKIVVDILNRVYNNGDIYQEEYAGWYSVFEERYFTEKDLVDGKDPIGGRPVEWLKEKNYFFRMSKYQDWLIEHYEKHQDAVLPGFRLNEVRGFLRSPLGDLCISRPKSRLSWGIPIPWDDDYVTYVWFDALINYYSATVAPPAGKEVPWPADYHLIGKDILTTHAVYWPIMLHAAGLEPPRHILAHGWWLQKDRAKMSKSEGDAIAPIDLVNRFGADAFRYALMREMVIGQDAEWDISIFINRINSDLVNDLGNLYSRLAKVWHSGGYGRVIPPQNTPGDIGEELAALRRDLPGHLKNEIDCMRPHAAIEAIMQLTRGLNQLVDRLKPWLKVKQDPGEIRDPLAWALDCLSEIAQYLEPVMPAKMAEFRDWIHQGEDGINPVVGKHLLNRIKPVEIETAKAPEKDMKTEEKERGEGLISLNDFSRMDLRVGRVTAARRHEGADTLLVVSVDLGSEQRQVVAGIAGAYNPDDLIGLNIVVVSNLKPVKLRGELSQGMLLTATEGENIRVVTVDQINPGAKVR